MDASHLHRSPLATAGQFDPHAWTRGARFFFDSPDRQGGSGGTAVTTTVEAPQMVTTTGELETLILGIPAIQGVQDPGGTTTDPGAAAPSTTTADPGAAAPSTTTADPGQQQPAPSDDPNAWLQQVPEEHRARIQQVMAERDTARREAEAARQQQQPPNPGQQQQQQAQQTPAAPKAKKANPLEHIATMEALDAEMDRAEQLRDFALEHLGGGSITLADGTTREITAEQARAMFTQYDAILRKHGPARQQDLVNGMRREQRAQQSMQAAMKEYPWLGKNDSPEYGLFQKLSSIMPELKATFGDWPEFVADMVAGYQARLGRKGQQQQTSSTISLETTPAPATTERKAATPTPAPVITAAPGGSRLPTNARQQDALQRVLQNGGDRDSIAAFLEAVG